MRYFALLLLSPLALGCPGDIVPEGDDDDSAVADDDTGPDDDDSGAAGDDDDTTGDDDTIGDDDTVGLEFDCSAIPEPPFDRLPLDAPRGYNDLVFDDEGAMIGSDSISLIRATSAVDWDVFAPGVGMVYKMGYLPSGDIVATTAGHTIVKIAPTGASSVLVGDFDGYGLAVGSDGMVYAGTDYTTDTPEIIRVDPSTGEVTRLIDATQYAPRGIEFSYDFSRLYFGTTNDGRVFGVDLDENLDPIADPEPVVAMPVS